MTDDPLTITVDAEPAEAEALVRDALSDQGFGILTRIDVQATLAEKLDVEMPPYVILGACNPPLAHRAIGIDGDIGTLLPCNVLVRAGADGGTEVLAADPVAMLAMSEQAEQLRDVADEARKRLEAALGALTD